MLGFLELGSGDRLSWSGNAVQNPGSSCAGQASGAGGGVQASGKQAMLGEASHRWADNEQLDLAWERGRHFSKGEKLEREQNLFLWELRDFFSRHSLSLPQVSPPFGLFCLSRWL